MNIGEFGLRLSAVGLALCVLTAFRWAGGVGPGEVVLTIALGLTSVSRPAGIDASGKRSSRESVGQTLLLTTLCIIIPSSVVFEMFSAHAYGQDSTAVRDILAYVFAGVVCLVLSSRRKELGIFCNWYSTVLCGLLALQIFFGGESAYYGARFTGGAKNPNQLALYLATLPVFLQGTSWRISTKVACAGFAGGLALFVHSQALIAGWFIGFVASLGAVFLPSRWLFVGLMGLVPAVFMLVMSLSQTAAGYLGEIWASADEGQSRLVLIQNGVSSWLDNPWSIIFGNGAGAFSGLNGPFEMQEAHNGIVDLASISGLVGVVILYGVPVRLALVAYRQGRCLLFGVVVAVIMFSLFHYVIRQPVFWVCLVVGFAVLPAEPEKGVKKKVNTIHRPDLGVSGKSDS